MIQRGGLPERGVEFLPRRRRAIRAVEKHVQIGQRQAAQIPERPGEAALPRAGASDHHHPLRKRAQVLPQQDALRPASFRRETERTKERRGAAFRSKLVPELRKAMHPRRLAQQRKPRAAIAPAAEGCIHDHVGKVSPLRLVKVICRLADEGTGLAVCQIAVKALPAAPAQPALIPRFPARLRKADRPAPGAVIVHGPLVAQQFRPEPQLLRRGPVKEDHFGSPAFPSRFYVL